MPFSDVSPARKGLWLKEVLDKERINAGYFISGSRANFKSVTTKIQSFLVSWVLVVTLFDLIIHRKKVSGAAVTGIEVEILFSIFEPSV